MVWSDRDEHTGATPAGVRRTRARKIPKAVRRAAFGTWHLALNLLKTSSRGLAVVGQMPSANCQMLLLECRGFQRKEQHGKENRSPQQKTLWRCFGHPHGFRRTCCRSFLSKGFRICEAWHHERSRWQPVSRR